MVSSDTAQQQYDDSINQQFHANFVGKSNEARCRECDYGLICPFGSDVFRKFTRADEFKDEDLQGGETSSLASAEDETAAEEVSNAAETTALMKNLKMMMKNKRRFLTSSEEDLTYTTQNMMVRPGFASPAPVSASESGSKNPVSNADFQPEFPFRLHKCFAFGGQPDTGLKSLEDLDAGTKSDDFSRIRAQCPGGQRGQCGLGRQGIACGACKDDYFDSYDGTCSSCKINAEESAFGGGAVALVMIFFLIFLPPLSYYAINGETTEEYSYALSTQMCFGSLLTTFQLSGCLGRMSLDWPEELQALFDFLGVFVFDVRFLKLPCAFAGANEALTKYLVQVFMMVFLILWFFASSWLTRKIPNFPPKYVMDFDLTVNSFGMIYSAVFMTFVMLLVQPLRCYQHPDIGNLGRQTSVVIFQDLICWDSDEHIVLVVVAILALLVLILGWFCYFCVQIYHMPLKSRVDPQWMQRHKFVYTRFRPTFWWWGAVMIWW